MYVLGSIIPDRTMNWESRASSGATCVILEQYVVGFECFYLEIGAEYVFEISYCMIEDNAM